MWKNRDEIGTGVEHVNRIRNYRREPGGSDSVAYGLASTILARSARQLPHDWRQRYGYTPLLLETLVDAERFRGTCYRAANWIHLGKTTGGSRTDRLQQARPKTSKLIFVLPLHRRAQPLLRIIDPPAVSLEG